MTWVRPPPILAVADVHVGNHGRFGGRVERGLNRRCALVLESLRQAAKLAHDEGSVLVVAGDLFDRHDPPAHVVEAVMAVLADWAGEVVLVCGNHDRADAGYDALGPLAYLKNVEVVRTPRAVRVAGHELLCAPFERGLGREWLGRAFLRFPAPSGVPRVLVTHLGLRTAETPWFLRDSVDAIDDYLLAALAADAEVSCCLLGNWHTPLDALLDGVELRQCGALAPTGWDDPGQGYGRVVGPGGWAHEVPGPRFLRWGVDAVDDGRVDALQYVSARPPGADVPRVEAELRALRDAGALADYEVLARVDAAVEPTRARRTLSEALRERVDAIDVPEPGDRERLRGWLTRELRV